MVAQNRIARLYMTGRGVEKNPVEAARWHLLATEAGMPDAQVEAFAGSLSGQQLQRAQKLALDWRNKTGIRPPTGRSTQIVKDANQLKNKSQ